MEEIVKFVIFNCVFAKNPSILWLSSGFSTSLLRFFCVSYLKTEGIWKSNNLERLFLNPIGVNFQKASDCQS